jgi:hypothetical protein
MTSRIAALGLTCLIALSAAAAPTQRSFVSAGTGNDANPCTRQLPCRNFAAAAAQTLTRGEIIALDSGGYGALSITQPISITSPPGVYAGVSVTGTDAIDIAVGPADWISISGLTLNNIGTLSTLIYGIHFTAGARLSLDRMTIINFATGVSNDAGDMTVTNSVTRGEIGFLTTGISASVGKTLVQDCVAEKHGEGVYVGGTGTLTAVRVTATGGFNRGFRVLGSGAVLYLVDSVASGNGEGVLAGCTGGTAFITGSRIIGNSQYGVRNCTATAVNLLGNNTIEGNTSGNTNGTMTYLSQQ